MTRTTQGYYGMSHNPCDVICFDVDRGGTWYAVEGSQNVNFTYEEVGLGVDVETLNDVDAFTWPDGIHCEDDLEVAVED